MKPLAIALTGINAVDSPGPGVGVARALKEATDLPVTIHGLAYDALEPGVFLDGIIDRSFLLPYPSGDPRSYLDRLYGIRDQYGLDVIIPNLDAELPVFIRYAQELADEGIRTLMPTADQFRLRSKDRLPALAEAIGIKVPPTVVVTNAADAAAAVAGIGGICWVKGCFYDAHRVVVPAQAPVAFETLAADWGLPVIVQGSVEGQHLNVVGVGTGDGGNLGLVAVKKVWTTKAGKMWTGITVRHEGMLAAAARFIAHTKWRGPFELECIVTEDDIYLIEINPRFPAWTYLAAAVGINLPERMIRHLGGEDLEPAPAYPAGRLFVRYSYELVTTMETPQSLIATGTACAPPSPAGVAPLQGFAIPAHQLLEIMP